MGLKKVGFENRSQKRVRDTKNALSLATHAKYR